KFAGLHFSGVVFDKIEASGFKYYGNFTSVNDKKQKVDSELHLETATATLEPLAIENFNYDALSELINIEPSFGKLDMPNFQARFSQYVDNKLMHKLKLVTQVTGQSMKANLNFGNIKSATGSAWKFSHGTFHIDQFGLKHPDIEYTGRDEKGELKEWTAKKLPRTSDSAIDLTGLNVTVMKDGLMYLDFEELAAKSLRVKQLGGGPTIDINVAKLKTAAVAMQNETPTKAFEILGATLKEIELEGVKVTYEIDRNAPSTGGKPTDPWSLDVLSTMAGDLRLYFTDAKFYADADVKVPISGGEIDFNKVNLEHIGPNSAMGVDRQGIYVDGVSTVLFRKHLYERNNIKDARMEVWEYTPPMGHDDMGSWDVTDRGALNLKGFVEQMLNDPKAASGEPPKQLEELNRMRLTGKASLGDDSLGTSKNRVTLSGKGVNKNQIVIRANNLGSNLTIELPDFQASKAIFEAGGKAGETGEITAKIKLDVTGLGDPANAAGHFVFTLTLTLDKGTVTGVKWGNVAMVSEAKTKADKQTKDAADEKAKEQAEILVK